MSARSGTAVIALRADRSARSGSQRAGRFVVRCTLADSQWPQRTGSAVGFAGSFPEPAKTLGRARRALGQRWVSAAAPAEAEVVAGAS